MVILPIQFCFEKSISFDLQIGSLAKTSTKTPEFIINTGGRRFVFLGKYVAIQSKFFTVDCQMTKKQQNILAEFYDKALVFTANDVRISENDKVDACGSNGVGSPSTADGPLFSLPDADTEALPATAFPAPTTEFISHFGCSKLADKNIGKSVAGRTNSLGGRSTSVPNSQSGLAGTGTGTGTRAGAEVADVSVDVDVDLDLTQQSQQSPQVQKRRVTARSASKVLSYAEGEDSSDCDLDYSQGGPGNEEYSYREPMLLGADGLDLSPVRVSSSSSTGNARKRKAAGTNLDADDAPSSASAKKKTPTPKSDSKATKAKAKAPAKPKTNGNKYTDKGKQAARLSDGESTTDIGEDDDDVSDGDWDAGNSPASPIAARRSVGRRSTSSRVSYAVDILSEDDGEDEDEADAEVAEGGYSASASASATKRGGKKANTKLIKQKSQIIDIYSSDEN